MRFFIFSVLLTFSPRAFGFLLSDQDHTALHYQNECIKESLVDSSMVTLARQHNRIPDNGELDALAVCILQKFKIMNRDGTINEFNNYSLGVDIIDSLKSYNQLTHRCKHEKSREIGEKARKVLNCFLKAGELLVPY